MDMLEEYALRFVYRRSSLSFAGLIESYIHTASSPAS